MMNARRYQSILNWLAVGWPLINDQLHPHDRETLTILLRRVEQIAERRADELVQAEQAEEREAQHGR
jgi:hypothetical protein